MTDTFINNVYGSVYSHSTRLFTRILSSVINWGLGLTPQVSKTCELGGWKFYWGLNPPVIVTLPPIYAHIRCCCSLVDICHIFLKIARRHVPPGSWRIVSHDNYQQHLLYIFCLSALACSSVTRNMGGIIGPFTAHNIAPGSAWCNPWRHGPRATYVY